jgi:gliding motility associated protien GldN
MKCRVILAVLIFGSYTATAQCHEFNGGPIGVTTGGIINGLYISEHIPTKRMIPYPYVREADVLWSKRVWEYIDLREKVNHPLYFPFDDYDSEGNWVLHNSRWSLWTIIKQHVMCGDLRAFSPYNPFQFSIKDGDQLKYPIDPQPGMNFYSDSVFRDEMFSYLGTLGAQPTTPLSNDYGEDSTITLVDGTIEYVYPDRDTSWFMSQDIVQYRLKEDWFFDKQRSVLDVRIIAMAPVVYQRSATGEIEGMRELFWLYFPHCRYVFNNYFTYNDKNDSQWMSFDDLFWKRKFTSVIYKESNTYDRKIGSYAAGADALHESELVKNEIRNIEHDVWSF